MTDRNGEVVQRPNGEVPAEHGGVIYFFMGTLADIDPFIGHPGRGDPQKMAAGWIGREFSHFGCLHPLRSISGALSPMLADTLILFPEAEDYERAERSALATGPTRYLARYVRAGTVPP